MKSSLDAVRKSVRANTLQDSYSADNKAFGLFGISSFHF